jgi:hypothetical protein
MEILRKAKKTGWTTDQLKFIVGSKTINENAMDTNLERLGINQKQKKKIKAATAKANIHGLLNILKDYYANTHQDSPKPEINEGTAGLKLMIDTRQALGKRPPCTNQNGTTTIPTEGKHTKRQTYEGAYTSLMPQVNLGSLHLPNASSKLHRGACPTRPPQFSTNTPPSPQPLVTQAPRTRPSGATTRFNNIRPPFPEKGQNGSPETTRQYLLRLP